MSGFLKGIIKTQSDAKATATFTKALGEAAGSALGETLKGVSAITESIAKNKKEKPIIQMAVIPKASNDYIGKNCYDVEKELKAFGLQNIALIAKKDLGALGKRRVGQVNQIYVDGKEGFKKKTKIKVESKVVIEFHDLKK